MAIGSDQTLECALELAELSGKFAAGCLEAGSPSEAALDRAAKYVRLMGIELVCGAELDPIEICASRLKELAAESPSASESSFDSEHAVLTAVTWRRLQQAVIDHDACVAPQFATLSKREQFIQRTLELAKVAGEIAHNLGGFELPPSDELRQPLADMVLLGVRLATAAGQELPEDEDVPRTMKDHSVSLMGEEVLAEYEEDE